MTDRQDLPAGGFSSWLHKTRLALAEEGAADVPCGACVACCRASYFIHIGPDEAGTLARIPRELVFAAPGQSRGALLLGYDEKGRCPMLRDGACSIYDERPRTCRAYDCRVFAAVGIDADRDEITARARRWVFDYPSAADRAQHVAVRAAARFLREHADSFPDGAVPDSPAQVAILAIKVYEVFLANDGDPDAAVSAVAAADRAAAIVAANEDFEAGRRHAPGADR